MPRPLPYNLFNIGFPPWPGSQVVEQFRLAALLALEELASQLEPLWQQLR